MKIPLFIFFFLLIGGHFVLSGQGVPDLYQKRIEKSATVSCSLDTAWWKWTTHEGLKTFFGEDNQIDLRAGGPFEIYFSMDAPEGLRGSEGCQVLAVLPQRMFSFTWNAPPSFPDIRNSGEHTWVVVEFASESPQKTRITLTHLGWRAGEDWDGVYDYFDKAWTVVLNWMEESCGQ